ncbi:MAG: hypothetical protein PWQ57_1695 [Desulfovibrionales bacterium]|jgi:hypothetical protein|nr:hypothetical protein [Desulfovibrionales bacterium]
MYQLVHVDKGKEIVIQVGDDLLFLKLMCERHTRSYASGWMEVRKA